MSNLYTPISLTLREYNPLWKHCDTNMDQCGHYSKSSTNFSTSYWKKTTSLSKTNCTFRNMVQQWAPRWHHPMPTFSWAHWKNHYYHQHRTISNHSYGKGSLTISFSYRQMERKHPSPTLITSIHSTQPSNLKSHIPPPMSISLTPTFTSITTEPLNQLYMSNSLTACHSYTIHHTIQTAVKRVLSTVKC